MREFTVDIADPIFAFVLHDFIPYEVVTLTAPLAVAPTINVQKLDQAVTPITDTEEILMLRALREAAMNDDSR